MTEYFKIATWNINSVRIRVEKLVYWLQENDPDIVFLQEIKCLKEQFPYENLDHLGYNMYVHGQKSYNGVAILSKIPADNLSISFPNNPCEDEARFIEISLNMFAGYTKFASVYVPNGGEVGSEKFINKLKFLENLKIYLETQKSNDFNYVIGGDFNVAPFDIDVFNPEKLKDTTCFTIKEKKLLRSILNLKFEDLYRLKYPVDHEFSWWDYRGGSFQKDEGMRIDYILSNSKIANFLYNSFMDKNERSKEKSSDHIPVVSVLKL